MASTADVALRIADCRDDQTAALQAFMAHAYRPDYPLCDMSLLRWQFFETPGAHGRWRIKLALRGEQIVGCLGYIPVDATCGGRTLPAAWVINWMVDREMRQLGLGPLLMREVMRQFALVMNVGPNETARAILARMGWRSYGPLPRHVAVLDRHGAAALTASGTLEWPDLSGQGRPASGSQPDIRVVERFDEQATLLWDDLARVPGHPVSGTRRSSSFLNWRYAAHPRFRYELLEQHDDGQLTGLAVLRYETARPTRYPLAEETAPTPGSCLPVPDGIRIARLVELIDVRARPGGGSALVSAVLDAARDARAAIVDFFCADRLTGALMSRHGFVSGAQTDQIPCLFQPVDRRRAAVWFVASGAHAAEPDAWYVTTGDGDQDRPN